MPTKTEKFIIKAQKIHNDLYDYSCVEYIHPDIKIDIICSIHGKYSQTPNTHINKRKGCPKCGYVLRTHNNLEKYGVQNTFQHKPFQEKQQQTKLERYGDKFFTNSELRQHTLFKLYGITNFFSGKHYQSVIKQTNLKKYGVEHPQQYHMTDILPLLNNYDWLFNEYSTKQKTATLIAQELNISLQGVCNYLHTHNIPITYTVGFSKIAIMWLETIMDQEQIHIRHMLNHPKGEYKIPYTRQGDSKQSYIKVDGFCEKTNTVYEFHGDRFHGNPNIFGPDEQCHPFTNETASELYQRTVLKEQIIKSAGYNLVVMWENDFDKQ